MESEVEATKARVGLAGHGGIPPRQLESTKRMFARGYAAFMKRRGLPEDPTIRDIHHAQANLGRIRREKLDAGEEFD